MYGRMIIDIAKRDAVRVFCDRLIEWLARQAFSNGPDDNDPSYRAGWNAAIRHVSNHLLR